MSAVLKHLDAACAAIVKARDAAMLDVPKDRLPARISHADYIDECWPHLGGEIHPDGTIGPFGPHGVLGYDWIGKTPSGLHATTPGSFWSAYGYVWTADHVIAEMFGNIPPFCAGLPMIRRPNGQDIAAFGHGFEGTMPPMPKTDDRVLIEGVTGGTRSLQTTFGTVYMQRPGATSFIVRQNDGTPLIEKGRSGGLVSLVRDGEYIPIGVTTIQSGGNVDSDGDGDLDRHMDFEPLRPALDAMVNGEVATA